MKLLLLLLAIAPLEAGSKVAFLDTRGAVASTSDGKAAAEELKRQFAPDMAAQVSDDQELQTLRASPDNVSVKSRIQALIRAREDRRNRFDAAQKKVLQDLSSKLMVVVDQYARQKHLEAILDISDPKTAIVWRADKTDITEKIVKLYDSKKR